MARERVDSVTDALNQFWDTARSAANAGWDATKETVAEGWDSATTAMGTAHQEIRERLDRISATALKALDQIQLEETDKEYILTGPWGISFSVTWRDLLAIGGIITSVIFATAAFFTGAILTGIIYLIYTGLLMVGAYWLYELYKTLPVAEMLQTNTTVARTTIETLRAVVGQFLPVLAGHEQTTGVQVEQLRRQHDQLGATATGLDAGVEQLRRLHDHLGATATGLDAGVAHLDAEVQSIPTLLNPIIVALRDYLNTNTEVLAGHREENAHLQEQTQRLTDQLSILGQRLVETNRELGQLEGLVQALRPIATQLTRLLSKFTDTGVEFATERQRLQAERQRLQGVIDLVMRGVEVLMPVTTQPTDAAPGARTDTRHVHFELPTGGESDGGGPARTVSPLHA